MRNPNGFGGIVKLSGNRRKPFMVRETVGWEYKDGKAIQIFKAVGYYATRKEAMLALAEYNRNPYDLTREKATFKYCYEKWSAKHYEQYKSSAAGLRTAYSLCKSIEDMPIEDIRLKDMQDIMDRYSDKSESYQTKLKTIFLKTFRFAMENDIVQKDYSQFVTIVHTPIKQDINNKFFTTEQIERIKQYQNWTCPFPIRTKLTQEINLTYSILILLYTGVRIGELLDLKLSDINLDERIIDLKGTKTAAARRLVPIHKDLIPIIQDKLSKHKEYLVENNNGAKITIDQYRVSFFNPFMKIIGAELTPHATRHTFISIMDKCGVPAESVILKRIVGHSNKTITEHYTHKDNAELLKAIDKFIL